MDVLQKTLKQQLLMRGFGDICVRAFDVIDSTNTEAKRMAADGFSGRAILLSGEQTGGRGRMGRSFYSPKNTGAYFSILYTPTCAMEHGVQVTCTAAVCVMRAIRTLTGKQCEIKWVNDLYYGEKKVCGILCEAVTVKDTTQVIVGIGVNLSTKDFPKDIASVADSLQEEALSPERLCAEVFCELSPYLDNPADDSWLMDYRAHSLVLGKEVSWIRDGKTCRGFAQSIDRDGALIVQDEDGESVRLHTGEVTLRLV